MKQFRSFMPHLLRCIAFGTGLGVIVTLVGGYLVLMYGPDLNQEF